MPLENTYTAVIDSTEYKLNSGDILIIPSGQLHQLYAPESGKRLIMQFDCSILFNLMA
jgi:quercetin dioxygenase-like cupin family protein